MTEVENNKMIIFKYRQINNHKIIGKNFLLPKGIYIYFNPDNSRQKYIIWNSSYIYITNHEKIFWKRLNRDIPFKVEEQKIYLINFCNHPSMVDVFLKKLREQEEFEEYEVDYYALSPQHENDIGYFYYKKFNSFITFENYDLCTCGSESWIEFDEENNLLNKIKISTNWFYY